MEFGHAFSVQDLVLQEQPDVIVLRNPDGLAALHRATIDVVWDDEYYQYVINQRLSFAAQGSRLIGACLCQRLDIDTGELLFIGVLPSWQQRGWAQKILAACIHAARAAGIMILYLEVEEDNIPAQALYASVGGEQVGMRRNYYGSGRDAQVWTLHTSYQRNTPAP
jgi:ribosomal-protein-alanine N-acetyltransferase